MKININFFTLHFNNLIEFSNNCILQGNWTGAVAENIYFNRNKIIIQYFFNIFMYY
jgi:hypothetical protein